jgi:5'(3')-deoxyribonucleotidase
MSETSETSGKKILYIDMDNTLVDFPSGIDRVSPALLEQYPDRDDIPGIFALMDPMPGAIEAVHELAPLFDLYVLSTAPWANPTAWHDKLEWIKTHFGAEKGSVLYKRLILSHHKHLNRGDFLVDDRPEHNGVDKFADHGGEVIHFGPKGTHTTWPEVVAYLKERA